MSLFDHFQQLGWAEEREQWRSKRLHKDCGKQRSFGLMWVGGLIGGKIARISRSRTGQPWSRMRLNRQHTRLHDVHARATLSSLSCTYGPPRMFSNHKVSVIHGESVVA